MGSLFPHPHPQSITIVFPPWASRFIFYKTAKREKHPGAQWTSIARLPLSTHTGSHTATTHGQPLPEALTLSLSLSLWKPSLVLDGCSFIALAKSAPSLLPLSLLLLLPSPPLSPVVSSGGEAERRRSCRLQVARRGTHSGWGNVTFCCFHCLKCDPGSALISLQGIFFNLGNTNICQGKRKMTFLLIFLWETP